MNNFGAECENELDCKTCDTCNFDDKNDDVKNFMGYNPDSCMNHFTEDQYTRMRKYFFRRRSYLISEIENLYVL